MDFEEEPVIQFYTIVKNENEENFNQEESENLYTIGDDNNVSNSIVYLTLQQEDEVEDDENNISDPLIDGIYGNVAKPTSGLKLVALENGQMYLAPTDSSDDNLSSLEPQLIPDITEEPPIVDEILSNTDEEMTTTTDGESNFREIQLEDGTSAYINTSLWNSLVEKTEAEDKEAKMKKKKFPCYYKECGKCFTTAHHLEVHTRIHTGDRPYICTEQGCDKAFATGYSLKAHSRTHTGEKPYGCSACFKHFKTSGDLQKHIRTHTGEKPFRCPIDGCEKSFTTSNIRKVHIRSHTGERPYKCSECHKAFASATNFKNHMRIHSGEKPYECKYTGCGKRFTEYSSLYKHNSVHQPFKIFQCEYCDQMFKFENTLKLHKKSVHSVVITEVGTELIFTDGQDDLKFDETEDLQPIDPNLLSDESSLQYGE